MTRKALSAAVKLEAIGIWCRVVCADCDMAGPLSIIQYDHIVPVAFGGTDDATNIKPICTTCHASKTYGNKATVASGDLHKIAKSKRLARAKEAHAAIVAKVEERKPSKIKSRPFAKGVSGFSKTQSRKWGLIR